MAQLINETGLGLYFTQTSVIVFVNCQGRDLPFCLVSWMDLNIRPDTKWVSLGQVLDWTQPMNAIDICARIAGNQARSGLDIAHFPLSNTQNIITQMNEWKGINILCLLIFLLISGLGQLHGPEVSLRHSPFLQCQNLIAPSLYCCSWMSQHSSPHWLVWDATIRPRFAAQA